MKRRDKILLVSLALFNDEGEPNVSTVDISNEMDISPGNLYYHFKGKDIIIAELFASFETELIEILQAPLDKSLDMKDSWFYLYVVFEHLYKFRFFYQNLSDILQRNPDVSKRFKRLLKLKYQTAQTLLALLAEHGVLELSEDRRADVTENIIIVLTYWINYASFRDVPDDEVIVIHRGVFQIMSIVAPFFSDDYQDMYQQALDMYKKLVD